MNHALLPSPLGPIALTFDGGTLTGLYFDGQKHQPLLTTLGPRHDEDPVVRRMAALLERYFKGDQVELDVPLAMHGTPFQQKVWAALQTIGRGRTSTYGDIARQIGSPAAVRAVGAAVGRNPVSIFVPCHRVIGRDGSLTGYAGGLERKQHLLALEGVLPAASLTLPGMPSLLATPETR
jgi:methylated-DNA-[protein]-cysteine S-methyltransferase